MLTLWQDLRYGTRMLLKNPGFTLVAVVTLALGIGASTTVFSLVNGALLRPLPFQEPERLMLLHNVPLSSPASAPLSDEDQRTPVIEWFNWHLRLQSFESLTAYGVSGGVTLAKDGEPERVEVREVTASFFAVMGAVPIHGRAFLPAEEQPGKTNVAIMSHDLWQRRFGSNEGVIGRTVRLNNRDFNIVGIAPAGFQYPNNEEFWPPFAQRDERVIETSVSYYQVLGRLKHGVSLEQARAELISFSQWMQDHYPSGQGTAVTVEIVPLTQHLTGLVNPNVIRLMFAVSLMMLIACVNFAGLLRVRATTRERELAIRAALGANRISLIRHLVIEGLLLALAGGLGGALLAQWGINLLLAISPAVWRQFQIQIDARVLGFSLLLGVIAGLLFGLLPAWRAAQTHPAQTLSDGNPRTGASRRLQRRRGWSVILETALALTLMIGAGLLLKSSLRVHSLDPGFNSGDTMVHVLALRTDKYGSPEKRAELFAQVRERMRHVPGLQMTDPGGYLPLSDNNYFVLYFSIEGHPPYNQADGSGTGRFATPRFVGPEDLMNTGAELVHGRVFNAEDTSLSTPVVIINEAMARQYWPGESPVGERLITPGDKVFREIVGVIRRAGDSALAHNVQPEMFLPLSQSLMPPRFISWRAETDLFRLSSAINQAVKSVDRGIHYSTIEQRRSGSFATDQFTLTLFGALAVMAMALVAIGVYGVVSHTVALRTREVGIRMLLGARGRAVLVLMLRQGVMLVTVGVLLGLGISFGLTWLLTGLLFGVSATDPLTFTAVTALVGTVALLACWVPARRATKVDPIISLRWE